MKTLLPLSLAALLLTSTAVLAQSQSAFDALDSDGDDKLSYSDLLPQFPDLTQAQFDAADLNSDDFLELSEFGSIGSQGDVEVAAGGAMAPAIDFPDFDDLDTNDLEKIDFSNLSGLGVTQEQFDAADIDNDDFLDRTQFEALRGNLGKMTAEPANAAVGLANDAGMHLKDVDSDGDGKVDFADLKAKWPELTQEQFDGADIDNDDFLDESQFASLNLS